MHKNLLAKSRPLAPDIASLLSRICSVTVIALAAGIMWGCGDERGTESKEVPPRDTKVRTPWHLINVVLYSENEPQDIQSYCTTFTIQGSVPDNINLYISPFNQRINQIPFYGGIQTHIDGYTDKNRSRNTFMTKKQGCHFFSMGRAKCGCD